MRIRGTRELAVSAESLSPWIEPLFEQDQRPTSGGAEQDLSQEFAGSGHVKGRTITHGSLQRGLWKVSWPILVTASCLSIVDLVHVQCAGKLSSNAQAIIGVCDQFMMMCVIVITSLSTAGTALVSKAYGARNTKDVVAMTRQMTLLLIGLAVVMAGGVVLLSKPLLAAFSGCVSNCDLTLHEGELYLGVVAYFLIPCAVVSAINATFIGIGNARVQLLTLVTMTVIDTVLNYFLLIAQWPVKNVGIRGIAAASISGYTIAAFLAGFLWFRSEVRKKHSASKTVQTATPQFVRPILSTGVPAAVQDIAWCSSTFVLFWILSLLKQPAEAVAAWTIGQRLEAFATLPLSALTMAVLVAVGQNLGSGRVTRAWKAGWTVTALAVGLLVMGGIGLFFLAQPLANGASSDETTRTILVSYLRVAAFGLPFAALEQVLSGSLQAMNDSRVPMIFSFVSNWIVGLSLTYLLAITLGQGATGAWVAMVVTTGTLGLLVAFRYLTRKEWSGLSPFVVKTTGADAPATTGSEAAEAPPIARGKKAVEIELPKSEPDL